MHMRKNLKIKGTIGTHFILKQSLKLLFMKILDVLPQLAFDIVSHVIFFLAGVAVGAMGVIALIKHIDKKETKKLIDKAPLEGDGFNEDCGKNQRSLF